MSDPRLSERDPRMTDPRDYRRTDLDPVDPGAGASNALWGWVAAALFVAAVLLFVFASGSGDRDSANNGINLPPTASAPKLPPSTTGSATTDSAPRTPAPAPAAPAPAAPDNR
jgi:hypothetical protein